MYLLGQFNQTEDADGGASRCSGSVLSIAMLPGETSTPLDYLTGRQIKPVVLTREATVRLQVGIQAKLRCLVLSTILIFHVSSISLSLSLGSLHLLMMGSIVIIVIMMGKQKNCICTCSCAMTINCIPFQFTGQSGSQTVTDTLGQDVVEHKQITAKQIMILPVNNVTDELSVPIACQTSPAVPDEAHQSTHPKTVGCMSCILT